MKKINIAKLLKDCPTGMELDCTMWDNVTFIGIEDIGYINILIKTPCGQIKLSKEGCFSHNCNNAKCVIFPKGKDTWEGFVPPCKFKDGDIIYVRAAVEWVAIYKENNSDDTYKYIGVRVLGGVLVDDCCPLCCKGDIREIRLATEEEKQKLFDAIKANGYKWNAETKTLEKLIEPKFKVGDKIQHKNGRVFASVLKIKADCYIAKDSIGDHFIIYFTHQDNYELIPNKFDISTLIPFESRVLVRNSKDQYWIPAFWGFRAKDGYVTTFGHCNYCIPFVGNEHLFRTKDDCSDFYKTWE